MKALFVCTGNSCRSVMAEYLFNHYAKQFNAQGWEAKSCGTAAGPSFPIPSGVKKALTPYGIEQVDHVPTLVNKQLIAWADTIYAMTTHHCEALKAMHPNAQDKIFLFLEKVGFKARDVDDPIGKSEEVYVECCRLIEKGIKNLFQNKDKEGIGEQPSARSAGS